MYQVAAHSYPYAKSSLQTHPERAFFSARTQLEMENVRMFHQETGLHTHLREIPSPWGLFPTAHLFFVVGLRISPRANIR